jgi:hypothetical protein
MKHSKQFGFYVQMKWGWIISNFHNGVRVDVPVWEDGLVNSGFPIIETIGLLVAAGKILKGALVGQGYCQALVWLCQCLVLLMMNGKSQLSLGGGLRLL